MKQIYIFLFLLLNLSVSKAQENGLPEGFVYVDEVIPDVVYDIRYAGHNNFIGKPVKGYDTARAILSRPAAEALAKVQKELIRKDLMLKVYDAYRPQRAVDQFVKWARDKNDTLMKSRFYPDIEKKDLFSLGYIASRSGHTRGSTIDLTLIRVSDCENLDMGSTYDFFGKISHHNATGITAEQKRNRELLKNIMQKHGFRPYPEEWWHYTFSPEPYPDTYFDFPIE